MNITKFRCRKCGEIRPRSLLDASRMQCKICSRLTYNSWREEHPKLYKKSQVRYRSEHPEYSKERSIRRLMGLNKIPFKQYMDSDFPDEQTCRKCGLSKEITEFKFCGRSVSLVCIDCIKHEKLG
jgi:hypothetical protein